MEQLRFCGIIQNNRLSSAWTSPEGLSFTRNPAPGITVFTNRGWTGNTLFEGFLYGDEPFNEDQLSANYGSWTAAILGTDRIILSRDSIGVRSMYYFGNDEVFCFANELKSLLALPFIEKRVSGRAVFNFLAFGEFNEVENPWIDEVNALPPGHKLRLDLKTLKYEVVAFHRCSVPEHFLTDKERAGRLIKTALKDAVSQIIAACPASGILLSGGLDSSVLAACARENSAAIPAITAITEDTKLNETYYAGKTVDFLNLQNWHQVQVGGIEREAETLHKVIELPTASLGSFLQFELFRFAHFSGVKGVLDGTGADALFGGHLYHQAIYWNTLIRSGKWSQWFRESSIFSRQNTFWLSFYLKMIAKYGLLNRMPNPLLKRAVLTNNPLLRHLNPDFFQEQFKQIETRRKFPVGDLNAFLSEEFCNGSVTNLLRFPDRISKYFSVMNFSVFSDYLPLYETGLAVDATLKIKKGQSKFILRHAFKDNLPGEVINRRDKMGLVSPNNLWMRRHKDLFMSYFTDDLAPYFLVNSMRDSLAKMLEDAPDRENFKIFKFISFAIWHKVFIKNPVD